MNSIKHHLNLAYNVLSKKKLQGEARNLLNDSLKGKEKIEKKKKWKKRKNRKDEKVERKRRDRATIAVYANEQLRSRFFNEMTLKT